MILIYAFQLAEDPSLKSHFGLKKLFSFKKSPKIQQSKREIDEKDKIENIENKGNILKNRETKGINRNENGNYSKMENGGSENNCHQKKHSEQQMCCSVIKNRTDERAPNIPTQTNDPRTENNQNDQVKNKDFKNIKSSVNGSQKNSLHTVKKEAQEKILIGEVEF